MQLSVSIRVLSEFGKSETTLLIMLGVCNLRLGEMTGIIVFSNNCLRVITLALDANNSVIHK
jgi:hypothetical protein